MKKSKYRDGRRNNKPPVASRFKPGQSGNPKGRPSKQSPALIELFAEEFNAYHAIEIDGRIVKYQTKRLLIRQAIRSVLKGNLKMLPWLIEMATLAREHEVRRQEELERPAFPTMEQLRNMSYDEKLELYRETIREVRR